MNSYRYLHKRILITSKARYEGSKRLMQHSWFSQWTLAFLAVGQIVFALLSAFKLVDPSIPESQLDMASLFFAVVVLTYSLLLGMGDFSARSSNIHQCGLQLAKLARKINYKVIQCYESSEYEHSKFVGEYYGNLNRHENHIPQDYLIASYDYKKEYDELPSFPKIIFNYKLKIFTYRIFSFAHYFLSIFSILAWGYYITDFSNSVPIS
ncbi:SLATT domain-containing protein [Psychromonas sp. MB-3u-54]|uniref:SLATT domain-containing protein n=1 Tax=Psychromonas sp. MB-3u-54 TaxID=2058319 RepID=UPI0012FEE8E3|nr:SLATT domain-containing protein [Psychromonas sp. MB-3u-54]